MWYKDKKCDYQGTYHNQDQHRLGKKKYIKGMNDVALFKNVPI